MEKWLSFDIKCPKGYDEIISSILYDLGIENLQIDDYQDVLDFKKDQPYWVVIDDEDFTPHDNVIIKAFYEDDKVNYEEIEAKINEFSINNKIDVIATDHCSFTLEDKLKGKNDFKLCPNGIPGVEERILLLFNEVINNRLSVEIFLKTVCENPAKIFGLFPKKGILTECSDADIVIFEKKDSKIENMHTAAGYSCYEDFPLSAVIDTVILRGNIIIRNNKLIKKSSGKFIKRI